MPALVVAIAGNPAAASSTALPASHAFGITNCPACNPRKVIPRVCHRNSAAPAELRHLGRSILVEQPQRAVLALRPGGGDVLFAQSLRDGFGLVLSGDHEPDLASPVEQ